MFTYQTALKLWEEPCGSGAIDGLSVMDVPGSHFARCPLSPESLHGLISPEIHRDGSDLINDYPLVNIQKANWKMAIYSGFSH